MKWQYQCSLGALLAATALSLTACENGVIGGGGGGTGGSTSAGGDTTQGGTTSSGGTTQSGGTTSSGGTTQSGGTGGGTTTTPTGGTGGAPSDDPCSGASDGKHCGGDLGGLADHNSVYTCQSGATSGVMPCPNGCDGGACNAPPMDPCSGASSGNGAYCSASLGAGDPETLYQCQNMKTASKMACPNGCQVEPPGTPDKCKSGGDPCANANAGNGAYCGGSIGGDSNVLYNCQNGATASQTTCAAGCQVMPPGVADACAPVGGGTCCLNKPPGVLTQSWSACGAGGTHYGIDYGTPVGTPIYAGMSGKVVSHALGFPNCYNNGCSQSCWNAFNYVKIKSDCGDPNEGGHDFFIWYLHINDLAPGIADGQHVDQGQLLAYSGNSGCSSGPHIHIETASVPAGQTPALNTCSSQDPAPNYCQ